MIQQLVTTRPTFTNSACEALDQRRDLVRDVLKSKKIPSSITVVVGLCRPIGLQAAYYAIHYIIGRS